MQGAWTSVDPSMLVCYCATRLLLSFDNRLHPTDLSVCQAHLDAVRVVRGVGEDVFDDATGGLACALVSLEYDIDGETGADIFAGLSIFVHGCMGCSLRYWRWVFFCRSFIIHYFAGRKNRSRTELRLMWYNVQLAQFTKKL